MFLVGGDDNIKAEGWKGGIGFCSAGWSGDDDDDGILLFLGFGYVGDFGEVDR